MRYPSAVLSGLVYAVLGLAQIGAAQAQVPPTIQRVTLQPDTGVITIAGTGLGPDLQVTVDGQPVTTLPGATDTQIEVQAPTTVLTTPGTYRLSVVDPARRVGDAFVVASPMPGPVSAPGTTPEASRVDTAGAAQARAGARGASALDSAALGTTPSLVLPYVIENGTNTAIGLNALEFNTTGVANTASGSTALRDNTTGSFNTATGASALSANTTGADNTASGVSALRFNTTGSQNTASGILALAFNTTGYSNTASGRWSLVFNTTGFENTATGKDALRENTTGISNTATGVAALSSNTTGVSNMASGAYALLANTTASWNTASGESALYSNTTGINNVATGVAALYLNVGGNDNIATGREALYYNTSSSNTAYGTSALSNTTTGGWNVGLGDRAGFNAVAGTYNVFLGAGVTGTAADTNTIRIGLPYDVGTGSGQNQTFIAGIWGNPVTGTAAQVFVDANGKLGTGTPVAILNGTATLVTPAGIEQQLQAQQAINAELQQRSQAQQATIENLLARLARLEALVVSGSRRK